MQYSSNKKKVFNRKNIVGFTVVVLILLVSSVVYYVLNKSPDIPFKTNVKNILTLQLDPKNCCVQINDFSVDKSGLAIATNEGLFFYDNNQKSVWDKKTNSTDGEVYRNVAVKGNQIFGVRTTFEYSAELKDMSKSFLDKFDQNGKKSWSLELPKGITSKQLISNWSDQLSLNATFASSITIESKNNKSSIPTYGKEDLLKLIVSTKDDSPEIVSYTHIGSSEDDGIISSQDNAYLDMLYLAGPSKISNSYIGGNSIKSNADFSDKQFTNKAGHYYCDCTTSNQSAFNFIRSVPGSGLVWRSIGSHDSTSAAATATYAITYSPIEIENDSSLDSANESEDDSSANYFITMYNESRMIESKLLNSDPPKEVEDKDKTKYIDPQISPALSTTKNSVVVGLETLDGTVKILRYSRDLSNQKSIDIGKGNLHNVKSFDDSYYAVVYGPESNKATVYSFN